MVTSIYHKYSYKLDNVFKDPVKAKSAVLSNEKARYLSFIDKKLDKLKVYKSTTKMSEKDYLEFKKLYK